MADNFPQWEEAHYNELNNPTTDLERYFRDRDKVVPYVASLPEPQSEVQPYKSTAHALGALVVAVAPPVAIGSVVVGFVYVVAVSVAAAAAAVMAFVSTYALPIGGGVLVAVALVCAVFGAKAGSEQSTTSQGSAQNINVTVNVAGKTVTTNQK